MSLRLDDELSDFEETLLASHLARCSECRAYEADLISLTATLRAAPVERPNLSAAPLRPGRSIFAKVQLGAAAAAVLLVAGVSTILGAVRLEQGARPTANATARAAYLDSAEHELSFLRVVAQSHAPRAI